MCLKMFLYLSITFLYMMKQKMLSSSTLWQREKNPLQQGCLAYLSMFFRALRTCTGLLLSRLISIFGAAKSEQFSPPTFCSFLQCLYKISEHNMKDFIEYPQKLLVWEMTGEIFWITRLFFICINTACTSKLFHLYDCWVVINTYIWRQYLNVAL